MHDSDRTLDLAKQIMRERQQQAALEAMQSRHSRSGMLARFLRDMADRIDPTGQDRKESSSLR